MSYQFEGQSKQFKFWDSRASATLSTHLLKMSTSSADFSDVKPGHQKRRPVHVSGLALALLSFQTLGMLSSLPVIVCNTNSTVIRASRIGIIYSDIGTSPLYVLNGIWSATGPVPPRDDIIGGISAIVWSLTLLPLCKYVSRLPLFILIHTNIMCNAT